MADNMKARRRREAIAAEAEIEASVLASVETMCDETEDLLARIFYRLGVPAAKIRAVCRASLKELPQDLLPDRKWDAARRSAGRLVEEWRRTELFGVVKRVLTRHDPDPDTKLCVRCGERFRIGEKIRTGWCSSCEIAYLCGAGPHEDDE